MLRKKLLNLIIITLIILSVKMSLETLDKRLISNNPDHSLTNEGATLYAYPLRLRWVTENDMTKFDR
jgi:hypothetical protein